MEGERKPLRYNKGKVECIDAIESATVGKTGIEAYMVGNIIKYVWRYEEKGGVDDVDKALDYCGRLLKVVKENEAKQKRESEGLLRKSDRSD